MGETPAPNEAPARDLDLSRLRPYLAEAGFPGLATARRIGAGQSCLTYALAGAGWDLVLRRPPNGVLARGAFDVSREHVVMSALSKAHVDVPVAAPVLLCEDLGVIGVPFLLMEHLSGVVLEDLEAPVGAPEHRHDIGLRTVDLLLSLHAVDPDAVGLAGYGRPGSYAERQLARLTALWERNCTRPLPEVDAVGAWLRANLPQPPRTPRIVHGDFGLHNIMFAAEAPPRVVALLDWEISTLGDPMADLGWLLYSWRDPGVEWSPTHPSVTSQPGFPSRSELVEHYARAAEVRELTWYVALAGWKLAVIHEGSYRRYQDGVRDHPLFADMEWMVPLLARRSLDAIEGRMQL